MGLAGDIVLETVVRCTKAIAVHTPIFDRVVNVISAWIPIGPVREEAQALIWFTDAIIQTRMRRYTLHVVDNAEVWGAPTMLRTLLAFRSVVLTCLWSHVTSVIQPGLVGDWYVIPHRRTKAFGVEQCHETVPAMTRHEISALFRARVGNFVIADVLWHLAGTWAPILLVDILGLLAHLYNESPIAKYRQGKLADFKKRL